ncbi:TPA: hypothetical protein SIA26_004582 [Aeromonas bestiarum]|nr:hypothetical protein [Aeromonas bestiarum]HEH9406988.1 hypothetical protein [Aeromonas bestiarum]
MKYRLMRLCELMAHEFLQIEANFQRAAFELPCGMTESTARRKLESGEVLLLADSPTIPLLTRAAEDEWRISEAAGPLVAEELKARVLERTKVRGGWGGQVTIVSTQQKEINDAFIYPVEVIASTSKPHDEFEYQVEVACPHDVLHRFVGCTFELAKTAQEGALPLELVRNRPKSLYSANPQTGDPRALRIKGGRVFDGLSITDVVPQPRNSRVRERYLAVMPAVQVGRRLAFPARGYYYHFIGCRLVQEYKIVSGWAFTCTVTTNGCFGESYNSRCQSALLIFDELHGAQVSEQYLVYQLARLDQTELDIVTPEWLRTHGQLLDLTAIHLAITKVPEVEQGALPALEPVVINVPSNCHYFWSGAHLDSTGHYFAIGCTQVLDDSLPVVNLWRAPPLPAYVINTILPYWELGRLSEVIYAMVEGLDTDYLERVAIVFGVNAPEADKEKLLAAVALAGAELAAQRVEVRLVHMTFKGKKFPYGTMRNTLMDSPETCDLVRRFLAQGWAPYLSFQDFDTGSRYLETGQHIFKGLDRLLAEDKEGDVIRPLMIAGGYRPQSRERLNAMTAARYPDKVIPALHLLKMDAFEAAVKADMSTRKCYASLDPMLPYAPEPNLFIDASLLFNDGVRPAFSQYGAEYEGLSSSLSACNKAELEAHYGPLFEAAGEGEVSVSRSARYNSPQLPIGREEIAGRLELESQTNRHPWRGIAFLLDFSMTVETDLSRLAYSYLTSRNGVMAQQHNLTYLVTRLFQTRGDKKGVRLSDIRSSFDYDCAVEEAKALGFLPLQEFLERHREELLGVEGARFSDYFSQRFSEEGVFRERYYNVPPSHLAAFSHQVAIEPKLTKRRRLD